MNQAMTEENDPPEAEASDNTPSPTPPSHPLAALAAGLGCLLFVAFVISLIVLGIFFYEKLLDWAPAYLPSFKIASLITFAVSLVIFGPLRFIQKTKALGQMGFALASILVGFTVWWLAFYWTCMLWGTTLGIIGAVCGGFLAIVFGLISTLFNGDLWPFAQILGMTIMYITLNGLSRAKKQTVFDV